MIKKRVKAIVSDYDGTLVPTANVKNPKINSVPKQLEEILEEVSSEIPVCVISTKDFEFLRKKTVFARMLSCIMGIETLILTKNHSPLRTIEKRILSADSRALQLKSQALDLIAEEVTSQEEFSQLLVERKHITDGILAGLTIDWRHLGDWSYYSRGIKHFISRLIANLGKPPAPVDIYVQKYSMHPFIDLYSIECNKGMAFDIVISELADVSIDGRSVIYLGDSENDNPVFRKAGISLGIRSDARLNPKLDCQYFLNYEQLYSFLMRLRKNDYLFSVELLEAYKL
jgi:HAD superfamily hydrolase (TIGR01484 family)